MGIKTQPTREQILEQPVGLELNEWVQRCVFGNKTELHWCCSDPECGGWEICPFHREAGFSWDGNCSYLDKEDNSEGSSISHMLRPCFWVENSGGGYWEVIPEYSQSWELAGKIAEKGELDGGKRWYYDFRSVVCGGWVVNVWDEDRAVEIGGNGETNICVFAFELPEAVAKAALLAHLYG
ncbi:MAG: hypothetical protein KGL39_00655 [Patescibacteria group bacterium]|nr:hypothetical protein [Patescibacteria group bacterium]